MPTVLIKTLPLRPLGRIRRIPLGTTRYATSVVQVPGLDVCLLVDSRRATMRSMPFATDKIMFVIVVVQSTTIHKHVTLMLLTFKRLTCTCALTHARSPPRTHTHTHTHTLAPESSCNACASRLHGLVECTRSIATLPEVEPAQVVLADLYLAPHVQNSIRNRGALVPEEVDQCRLLARNAALEELPRDEEVGSEAEGVALPAHPSRSRVVPPAPPSPQAPQALPSSTLHR